MNKLCIILFLAPNIFFCQNNAVNTNNLESLIDLKTELINDYKIKSYFTIQIFSGQKTNAIQIKNTFDNKGQKYKSNIIFDTPNYKVWVGRFRTKLEADKVFSALVKDYPSSFVFNPGRKNNY